MAGLVMPRSGGRLADLSGDKFIGEYGLVTGEFGVLVILAKNI